nr:ABC transporter permease [Rhodobacter capsulatus]
MVFPLVNVIETLDTNQIEAARDLGAKPWQIHWRIVLPHARPGIAVGGDHDLHALGRVLRRALCHDPRHRRAMVHPACLQPLLSGDELERRRGLCVQPARGLHRRRLSDDEASAGAAEGYRPMSATPDTTGSGLVPRLYMGLFFAYMFLPLILMVAAGVNACSPPSVTVWQGFTLHWLAELGSDTRMWSGLRNSILIAAAVIALSLPMGLAGALLLRRLSERRAGLLYAAMVSPLLTPGIVLGVSTVIFWRNFDVAGGLFTAILAQTTFIASYAMLMITARLQRQDASLEEAARDLGATPFQAVRRITLPFLRPTLVSAAVIAFLQSFENYNTTMFAIGGQHTLVTEIGSRMRFGLSPVVNVIGILVILVTVVCAVIWAVLKQNEGRKAKGA